MLLLVFTAIVVVGLLAAPYQSHAHIPHSFASNLYVHINRTLSFTPFVPFEPFEPFFVARLNSTVRERSFIACIIRDVSVQRV